MEVSSTPFSAGSYVVTSQDGEAWPPRRFAIMPEPDRLACLEDFDESPDESRVRYYAEYLRRHDPHWVSRRGSIPIFWSVLMEGNGAWCPPFPHPDFPGLETWNAQGWSTPICQESGKRVDWFRLPIVHRFPEFWRELGFNPAPFQRRLDLQDVLAYRFGITIGR